MPRLFRRREPAGNAAANPPAKDASASATAAAPAPALQLRPIGVVRNGVTRPRPDGWQAVESRLVIMTEHAAGLCGIEGFSHLIVLTWLHLALDAREAVAIQPGGAARLPPTGVFALRVAGRPNPIGVSVVPLLRVEGTELLVRGLDVVDGTPLLDLKPYLPPYDSVPGALLPGWASG
ncbi:MAG TPA: tRNA (N6-threonylcarbamoyladenosine(37)-N6)-methyltransferase TrmO [Dehalococcoidia bacterium]|nr:tRNA (N6-threonylcarbamoyladenosine(37)-N6)-methyltransferase TrmO [Dehalococcoidia bacterium]